MRNKNILVTVAVSASLFATIANAEVYCPTQLVCYNDGTCKNQENNGIKIYNATTKRKNAAGIYGFMTTATNAAQPSQPICWYFSLQTHTEASAYASSSYNIAGPNWWIWQGSLICPGTIVDGGYTLPQACAFSVMSPKTKK